MKEQDYSARITDEWRIGDVLQWYPSTCVIFLQRGPASRTQSSRPLPDHPRVDLQEYAELRGMDKESLLQALNAR
jgi:hypothetical protein